MSYPNLAGVPRLKNFIPSAGSVVRSGFGIIQASGWQLVSNQQEWGIFDKSGKPLVDSQKLKDLPRLVRTAADVIGISNSASFNSMEFTKEFRVSNFPVEDGGFASYNKVGLPGEAVVTLCMGGSEADRKSFLDSIDGACGSTNLYDIKTPTATYINYSINRYSYSRRSESGAQLLIVTLEISEVKFVTSVRTTVEEKKKINAKKPEGASPKDSGITQAKPVGKNLLKAIAGGSLAGALA